MILRIRFRMRRKGDNMSKIINFARLQVGKPYDFDNIWKRVRDA